METMSKNAISTILSKLFGSQNNVEQFPVIIHIENTNICNAHCTMCPRDEMDRPQGVMGMELYGKILDEVTIHKNVRELHLHGFGEPLIDKNLVEKIRLAKQGNIPFVYFVTNASLLTPELSEKLVASGLDSFKISFYGHDSASYEEVHRGLEYQRTVDNITRFIELRDQRGGGPSLRLQFMDMQGDGQYTEKFVSFWKGRLNKTFGDSIYLSGLHSWSTESSAVMKGPAHLSCLWINRDMQILWDGRVVPCCYDFNGVQVLGDVNFDTIGSIWTGEKYLALRQAFKDGNVATIPLCSKCEHYGFFSAKKIL